MSKSSTRSINKREFKELIDRMTVSNVQLEADMVFCPTRKEARYKPTGLVRVITTGFYIRKK